MTHHTTSNTTGDISGHSSAHDPEHTPDPGGAVCGGCDDGPGTEEPALDELVVALYRQGRSAREVSRLVQTMTAIEVTKLVHTAGVVRERAEATSLSNRRVKARQAIARADLAALAGRWIAGVEVEELAAEAGWPPDLLWDALADTLSAPPSTTDSGTDSGAGTAEGMGSAAQAVECVGVCTFQCAQRCALTTGSSYVRLPGEPFTRNGVSNPRRRRDGIPSVRTGLTLPAPGPRFQW